MEDLKSKLIAFAVIVFSALGVYIGGYYHGKNQAPTKMVETVKVVEVVKEVVVEREKVRIEIVKVKDTQVAERYHREKTETTSPDGTKVVKEVEDRNIDTVVKEKENSTEVRVVEVIKEVVVEKKVDVVKVVENDRPDWEVMAKVGTNISEFKPQLTAPYFSPLLLGVDVNRRLVGPVKAGAWAMSNTRFDSVSAGLSLGVEF